VSSLVLFIIALVGPWAVHLAPPRSRAVAVMVLVAILLLFGIFAHNPLTSWLFWIGLILGIASIAIFSGYGSAKGSAERRARREPREPREPRPPRERRPRTSRRQRSPLDEGGSEPTGEL
jgi:hypothetical protein